MARTRSLLAVALAVPLLAGCRTVVEAPAGGVDRPAIYQTIANALPRAELGWGSPPGIVALAASTKAAGPPPPLEPLLANERGFRIRVDVYRPRTEWIPYGAVTEAAYGWKPLPNVVLAPLLVVPLQIVRTSVVVDTGKLPGFRDRLERDLSRLEAVSREVGMGGPWAHARAVRAKVAEDEAAHGPGSLALHFDYVAGVPAWLPWGGEARRVASAFAWAAAHPDAAILPEDFADRPDPEAER